MPKNIIEVTHSWPTETFIQRHLNALDALNFPVRVVARYKTDVYTGSASLSYESGRIAAQMLPNFNHLQPIQKVWSLRHLTSLSLRAGADRSLGNKVMLGYFERLHPDLIHFHDASLAASMKWIPQTLRIPYTVSLRGSDIQVLPNQSEAQKADIIAALRGARKIHAVCNHLGGEAKKIAGTALDVQTIYTTVPFPAQLNSWFGENNQPELHFVSSGRLIWRKGFAQLLIALRHFLDQGQKARLTIIGTGPDLDFLLYLRKVLHLEDCITLTGKLSYAKTSDLLGSAHAYIQSSVAEGLSNALVEAIASGVPVFATDVNGTSEIVQDGVTGFLLPPLQPEKWSDILANVRDGLLMDRVRRAAYQKAAQIFSSEQHGKTFADFFSAALQAKSNESKENDVR